MKFRLILLLAALVIMPVSAVAQQAGGPSAMLPPDIRQSGVLRIAGDASFPPFFYLDEHNEYKGFDVDVTTAVTKILGIKPEFTNIPTDGVIAGLQAHRYDVGVSGLIDRPVREEVLDFVEYYHAFQSLIVRTGNPDGVNAKTICGKEIAVGKGTAAAVTAVPHLSEMCEKDGKPAIKISVFPTYPAGILAIQDARVQAGVTLFPINRWIEQRSNGKLQDAGPVPGSYMIGLGVAKGNDQLVKALFSAVDQIMKDGTYKRLLAKYDIGVQPLDKPAINQPNLMP
jgi:polar amino acid transport system substrate-binding protein